MDPGKVAANRGVPRNKKPLQNICYRFEERKDGDATVYTMLWQYQRDLNKRGSWNFHGRVTEAEIMARIGPRGWQKFRGNKQREFIIQRREDGRNVPKKKPVAKVPSRYVVKLGPEEADLHTAMRATELFDGGLAWVDTAGVPHIAAPGTWSKETK
jgi:hypothetical protein